MATLTDSTCRVATLKRSNLKFAAKMAFIVYDTEAPSFLGDPGASYLIPSGTGNGTPPRNAQRKLLSEFEDDSYLLAPPSEKELLKVYLRVKPKTEAEAELSNSDAEDTVKIETDHQIALKAPEDSNTYKNDMNNGRNKGAFIHRHTFTKIFGAPTSQKALFAEMVMPRMKDFLEGQNQLLFTYGATSSGKTYTIQGSRRDPGIIPRALDVIFNSVGERQTTSLELKPNCFNRVVQMKEKDVKKLEEDKTEVFRLAVELERNVEDSNEDFLVHDADVTNMSQESLTALFPDLAGRAREDAKVELNHAEINYAVWISFAEIYNENIYDLLEKMPAPKRKGDAPRRTPLRLAEDRNGSIYVKGLRDIKVNSADEAYKVMMIGRQNLRFAATRLNHHSSRSHCVFTVKVIRVAETKKPHLARVSMLSFCDLAGAERIKKTMNTGMGQKEAGNINTSLLVLGRCIKAIRENQKVKVAGRQIVPYRESKLTRMFQSFLCGYGKAAMIVNVSQAPYLFDETIQVMKFASVASRVFVEQAAEVEPESPETPETVKPNRKRDPSRFSMVMADASHARGSIAWEPAARSTLMPMAKKSLEETFTAASETTFLDDTLTGDARYEALLKLIDKLKDELIKEKQEKIDLEKDIRTELCDEFNSMMVEIEQSWEKRLQGQIERTEELAEWRLQRLQKELKGTGKRKSACSEANDKTIDETANFEKVELEMALEEKTKEIECLSAKAKAMKDAHNSIADDMKKHVEENRKLADRLQGAQEALKKAESETEAIKRAMKSDDPLIEELKKNLAESEAVRNDLKSLLDEAGNDFLEKESELAKATQTIKDKDQDLIKATVAFNEQSQRLEELRQLMADATSRLEEKENQLADLEEQLESKATQEEFDVLKTQRDQLEEALLKEKQLGLNFTQEKSKLIGQISELKEAALTEKKDSKRQLDDANKQIDRLENEVKSLIQAEMRQRAVIEDLQGEIDLLKKQLKKPDPEAEKLKAENEKLKIRVGSE